VTHFGPIASFARMFHLEVRGMRMPALGLGTWQLQGDECRRAVEAALELGYRHLDTAQGYDNEREVGAALKASGVAREEVFLTTKAWPDHLVEDASTVEKSLERLGVARVDLLLMHWPSPKLPLERTVDALAEALDRGQTRFIGVSNFPTKLLEIALARAPIVCNQVEYHPFLDQTPLLKLCRERDVVLGAYSPLARGHVSKDEVLAGIGARHGRTGAQVALRWLLQQRGVAAVPKASSERHLRANLEVLDFALSDEEMAKVGALRSGRRYIDPEWGPDWDA
jgi:2,5-diketo-D-gluconate reductase B